MPTMPAASRRFRRTGREGYRGEKSLGDKGKKRGF